MYEPLSLRRNFVWTFGGSGIYSACQWGVLVAIAKLSTVEKVGQFSLAVAICAPIILFTGLSLRVALASDVKGEYNFGVYFALRVVTAVFAFLAIGCIALFSGYPWDTKTIILLIAVNKLIEDASTVMYGRFQKHERMDIISRSMSIRGVVGLGIFAIVLLVKRNILYSVIGWGCWSLTTLIAHDLVYAYKFGPIRPSFDWPKMVKLAVKTFPLAIVMGIMSLKTNIPRYFIANYGGVELLGYFSAVMFILMAANLPNQALATAAITRLSKYYAGNHKHFINLYWRLMGIALVFLFIAVGICWLFGKQILAIAYRPDYAEYWNVLCIGAIGAGLGFFVSMGSSAFTATRRFYWQPLIYGIVLVTSLLSCSMLIPKFGIIGAAWSMVITTGVHALLFLIAVMISMRNKQKEQAVSADTIVAQ